MSSITVYINEDYSTLGVGATQDDLDRYAENLEEHLSLRFGRDVTVETCLGGERAGRKCLQDDEINDYVRELEAGDGWVEILGEER